MLFHGQYKTKCDDNVHFVVSVSSVLNPFARGDFTEKRVLKLVEWFSGHGRAIKS